MEGDKTEKIRELLKRGNLGVREIARQVGCSPSLVIKVKKRGERLKPKEFIPYTPPNMGNDF